MNTTNSRSISGQDPIPCPPNHTGRLPTPQEMTQVLAARHGRGQQQRLAKASVAILGLGGLGSCVAVALVKMGIGRLLLCDYDVVDLSNIHRQQYFLDQMGQRKTEALHSTLIRSNPFVAIRTVNRRITAEEIPLLCAGCDVVVECFDDAQLKAACYQAVRLYLPQCGFVGASGVAGFGQGEQLTVRRIDQKTFMIGDFSSEVSNNLSLTATRVGIAAHLQAHQVVRMVLDLDTPETLETTGKEATL